VGEGTEVEESWQIIRDDERITGLGDDALKGLMTMTETGIETTLANLKKIAES
jgi:hypothetical protein